MGLQSLAKNAIVDFRSIVRIHAVMRIHAQCILTLHAPRELAVTWKYVLLYNIQINNFTFKSVIIKLSCHVKSSDLSRQRGRDCMP